MAYRIIFSDEKLLAKDFANIPKINSDKIMLKLNELITLWIRNAQVKKLNHFMLCDYRLRVWDYRVFLI